MYNYQDLMQMLQAYQAQYDQNAGGMRIDNEGRRLIPGDPGYEEATDPRGDRNSFSNGLTGNQGVTYAFDPATNSFRIAQGDSTSGIQRYNLDANGLQDLGFENIDRNGKYNQNLGKMAAIAGAVVGAGSLAEAWAAGSGLSTGAQGAFVASPEQMAANAAWSSGGAAEVAGGAGASALEGGSLGIESILGSNYAAPSLGAELGAGALYGAPTTAAGAGAAMTGAGAVGPLLEGGLSGSQLAPVGAAAAGQVAANAAQNPGNRRPSILETLANGGQLGVNDIARLLAGGIGSVQQYNFGQDLLQRAEAATPNRGFYEGQLRQSYENPGSYLQSPDFQAAFDITHNKLQRSDAAGGRLANDYGRQVGLQNYALQNLNNYRQGLAGIVGQQASTYSGQNAMFQNGAAADNSWRNGILWGLLGATQGGNNAGRPIGAQMITTGPDGRQYTDSTMTRLVGGTGLPNWLGGAADRSINLDAIA